MLYGEINRQRLKIISDSGIYDAFGDACFGELYTQRIYCSGRIRMGAWGEDYPLLRNVDGELRWYTASNEYTTIA